MTRIFLTELNGDGSIQYFDLQPYFHIDGLGGFGLKHVYVGFPGFDLATELGLEVYTKR